MACEGTDALRRSGPPQSGSIHTSRVTVRSHVGFRPHQPCLGGSEQKAAQLQPFCYPEDAGEEGERGPQDRKGKLLAAPGAKPSRPRGSRKAGTGGSSPGLGSFSSRGISLVWLPATSNLEPMESGNQKHHRWHLTQAAGASTGRALSSPATRPPPGRRAEGRPQGAGVKRRHRDVLQAPARIAPEISATARRRALVLPSVPQSR